MSSSLSAGPSWPSPAPDSCCPVVGGSGGVRDRPGDCPRATGAGEWLGESSYPDSGPAGEGARLLARLVMLPRLGVRRMLRPAHDVMAGGGPCALGVGNVMPIWGPPNHHPLTHHPARL